MSSFDPRFEAGIAHLHRYVAEHGSSSPPRGATIDGFAIGQWVVNRRAEYRRGGLSPERIRRIETDFPDWLASLTCTGIAPRTAPATPPT